MLTRLILIVPNGRAGYARIDDGVEFTAPESCEELFSVVR